MEPSPLSLIAMFSSAPNLMREGVKISEPLICPVCGEVVDELFMVRRPRCWECLDPKQRYEVKNPNRTRELIAAAQARFQQWQDAYKSERGCEICGESNPIMLDFHHLDPSRKSFGVSTGGTRNLDKVIAEAEKCVILCANHHREFHHLYGASPVPSDFTSYREQYSQENHEQ